MSFHFIDWMFVLGLVILVFGMKITREETINKDYLSVRHCNAVRGYFSLMPLLVHIANCIQYNEFTGWFTTNGNAIVGGFFFFTGFGLMKQYVHKEGYDKGFLLKRLPKVLIPYIIMTFVYWVADFIFLGFLYPVSGIFHAIACGVPIVTYSWYIIHVLAFYVLFFVLMKLCKKHYLLMVLGGVVYYILTAALFVHRGFGMHWYQTSLALPIGMAFAVYEEKIYKFMSKYYYYVALAVLAVTFVVYEYGLGGFYKLFPEDYSIHNVCVSTLMVICIIVVMMKITFDNKVLQFLGKISFEIYLIHGLVILAARNDRLYIENEMVFSIVVIVVTIVASVAFNCCMTYVFRLWDRLVGRITK